MSFPDAPAVLTGPGLLAAAGWGVMFVGPLLVPRRASPARARSVASVVGVGLHYAAIGLPFLAPAPAASPGRWIAAAAGALFSAALFHAAVRGLGSGWSLLARVTDRHRLVTDGPYAIVRHPIYVAVTAHLLATSAACGGIGLVLLTMLLGGAGTALRIRAEERLLRDAFGRRWDAYVRTVPALLPHRRPARSYGSTP